MPHVDQNYAVLAVWAPSGGTRKGFWVFPSFRTFQTAVDFMAISLARCDDLWRISFDYNPFRATALVSANPRSPVNFDENRTGGRRLKSPLPDVVARHADAVNRTIRRLVTHQRLVTHHFSFALGGGTFFIFVWMEACRAGAIKGTP